jgi:hypothetical protein
MASKKPVKKKQTDEEVAMDPILGGGIGKNVPWDDMLPADYGKYRSYH